MLNYWRVEPKLAKMINERSGLVEDYSSVVLTFFDHSFASFGKNKTGTSPGIANKTGTLLWDDQLPDIVQEFDVELLRLKNSSYPINFPYTSQDFKHFPQVIII